MTRAAKSLDVLLGQLNRMYPQRSKISDGGIGDAAHATRVSDHNPDANGIFHARDFTHDPGKGINCVALARWLTTRGDKRIKYVIWDHRIWQDGKWATYDGPNPHDHHLHLSVKSGPLGDDDHAWNIGDSTPEEDMQLRDEFDADNPVWRDKDHENTVGGVLAYLVAMGKETQRRVTNLAAKVEATEETENPK